MGDFFQIFASLLIKLCFREKKVRDISVRVIRIVRMYVCVCVRVSDSQRFKPQ